MGAATTASSGGATAPARAQHSRASAPAGGAQEGSVSSQAGGWASPRRTTRREQRGFPGAARIARDLAEGPARTRVALSVLEGAPDREGAEIADADGKVIGVVTSGG